jgi:tetratricopeptide (TPR) repeat protein
MLARQYGASREIDVRRARLDAAPAPAADEPPAAADSFFAAPTAAPAPAQTDATEVAFEFNVENAAAPNVAAPVKGIEPHASQRAATVALDPGLAAIFDEFRNSVEEDEEADASADYETHYNTGLAYMEMGMLDMAVEEFQTAATLCAPADGTPRYLQCCNLLGHCFMQQNVLRAAVIWFKKGLAAPGHSEEEYQALRYELAHAYEQLGDLDRALDTYQEVYGIDVSYRGVSDKLKELQALKTVTSDR